MHRTGAILLVAVLAIGGCSSVPRPGDIELTYQVDQDDAEQACDPEILEHVRAIVEARLRLHEPPRFSVGVKEGNLLVRIPEREGAGLEVVRSVIEKVGKLELALVALESEQTEQRIREVEEKEKRFRTAEQAWLVQKREHDAPFRAQRKAPPEFTEPRPSPPELIARPAEESAAGTEGETDRKEKLNHWGHHLTVLENSVASKVSGRSICRAQETYDEQRRPAVAFGFNSEGAAQLAALTEANTGRFLAIVFDDQIRMQAQIRSRIAESGQITGNYTRAEAQTIVTVLQGGSLPAKLKLISETRVPETR